MKYVVNEQSAVENSFSTYVCYAPDGLFWLNLYFSVIKYFGFLNIDAICSSIKAKEGKRK